MARGRESGGGTRLLKVEVGEGNVSVDFDGKMNIDCGRARAEVAGLVTFEPIEGFVERGGGCGRSELANIGLDWLTRDGLNVVVVGDGVFCFTICDLGGTNPVTRGRDLVGVKSLGPILYFAEGLSHSFSVSFSLPLPLPFSFSLSFGTSPPPYW